MESFPKAAPLRKHARKDDNQDEIVKALPMCARDGCESLVKRLSSKTCSNQCAGVLKRLNDRTHRCAHCGEGFETYEHHRLYCSYPCFIASGGAFRAGAAAAASMRLRAYKTDFNHAEVVEALRKIGASVCDMAAMGQGFPDLLVGYHGKNHLIEVKNPKTAYGRRGLNKLQRVFADGWRGAPVLVVMSGEDAVRQLLSVEEALDLCKRLASP